jgi:hypothetical protein
MRRLVYPLVSLSAFVLIVIAITTAAPGDSRAAGQCSVTGGTWGVSFPAATVAFQFAPGGTGTWDVRNSVGDNGGAMNYTFDGSQLTYTNTTVTHQQDPHFFPCLNITGTYRVTFSADCNTLTETLVSDTCPVRRAMTLTRH